MKRKQEIILEIVHVVMITGAIASFILETVYNKTEVASNVAILCSFIGGLYGVTYVPVIRHDYLREDEEQWLKQNMEKNNQKSNNQSNKQSKDNQSKNNQ